MWEEVKRLTVQREIRVSSLRMWPAPISTVARQGVYLSGFV